MQELIEQFVKEKGFLKTISPETVSFYYQSLKALIRIIRELEPPALSKAALDDCVIKMRGIDCIPCTKRQGELSGVGQREEICNPSEQS